MQDNHIMCVECRTLKDKNIEFNLDSLKCANCESFSYAYGAGISKQSYVENSYIKWISPRRTKKNTDDKLIVGIKEAITHLKTTNCLWRL